MKESFLELGFALSAPVLGGGELEVARAEATRLSAESPSRGGARSVLQRSPYLRQLAGGVLADLAGEVLDGPAMAVKATLFDKTQDANWKVPWHQDLTIAVRERLDVPGFGPWSVKDGVPHVQAPVDVLERMVAVRLHLDDTPADNGALRVLPGTHRLGRIGGEEIEDIRATKSEVVCAAHAGQAMMMSPLLLHASSASRLPGHRRVLHVEYACDSLPGGLSWFR